MGVSLPWRRKASIHEVVAIDLGTRMTKAVHLRAVVGGYFLLNYTLREAPVYEKDLSQETLARHIEGMLETLAIKSKDAVLVLNANQSFLMRAEMPQADSSDLRKMVKLNPKNYLKREVPDSVFDCFLGEDEMVPDEETETPRNRKQVTEKKKVRDEVQDPSHSSKWKCQRHKATMDFGDGVLEVQTVSVRPARRQTAVLLGGAGSQLVADVTAAATRCGLVPQAVTLSQIGFVNAFLSLRSDVSNKTTILLDVGFHSSTVSAMWNGHLILTRVVDIGADRLTAGLAKALKINYSAAEGIKVVMPNVVAAQAKAQMAELAREIQASMDYLDSRYDVRVEEILVSGGTARSKFLVEMLQAQVGVPCRVWIAAKDLTSALSPRKEEDLVRDGPQLTTAIGAGLLYIHSAPLSINLLAEAQEEAEMRRRDPVPKVKWATAAVVALLLMAGVYLQVKIWQQRRVLTRARAELAGLQSRPTYVREVGLVTDLSSNLSRLAASRFLWASALDALQQVALPDIQVVRLEGRQVLRPIQESKTTPESLPDGNRAGGGPPAKVGETITWTIAAKDYGEPPQAERFIQQFNRIDYFRNNLRESDSVLLRDRQSRTIDPTDIRRSFILFSIECTFAERTLTND